MSKNIDGVVEGEKQIAGMQYLGQMYTQDKPPKAIDIFYSVPDDNLYHRLGEVYVRSDKMYTRSVKK